MYLKTARYGLICVKYKLLKKIEASFHTYVIFIFMSRTNKEVVKNGVK